MFSKPTNDRIQHSRHCDQTLEKIAKKNIFLASKCTLTCHKYDLDHVDLRLVFGIKEEWLSQPFVAKENPLLQAACLEKEMFFKFFQGLKKRDVFQSAQNGYSH